MFAFVLFLLSETKNVPIARWRVEYKALGRGGGGGQLGPHLAGSQLGPLHHNAGRLEYRSNITVIK
ncbi:hypothetical protein Taro_013449 [Colocasia esculenta]|uniref:Uncharacterized protein n=1 Tax=Colocasia esculenta TaxID=4460 RepID=A0A843UBW3_COLES|nr:hypothetical protein [Colocasia esculenta]